MAGETRIQQLQEEGKKGQEIAEILLSEGYRAEDALKAFIACRYVAQTVPLAAEPFVVLHISDTPLQEPEYSATLLHNRDLPYVVWIR